MSRKLTDTTLIKYKTIIAEYYTNGFDKHKAYTSVHKDASYNSAMAQMSRIINHPELKDYIKELQDRAKDKTGMTHERVLDELRKWLEADLTEAMGLSAKQIKKLPSEIRQMITKFRINTKKSYDKQGFLTDTTETVSLEFVSKEKAIEMISRHIGFYELDNNQKSKILDLSSTPTSELINRAKAIRNISNDE